MSLATLGDCSFVAITPGVSVTGDEDEDFLVKALGLVTYAKPNGTCYWYNSGGSPPEDQILDYFDFLGSNWRVARIMGAIGAAGGFLFTLFSISLCCSSHALAVRFFSAFLLNVVLTLFQCLTFLAFTSEICQENECKFSRTAGWCVGAAACFSASGLCFVLMQDYPGKLAVTQQHQSDQSPKPVPPCSEQAPVDENETVSEDVGVAGATEPVEEQKDIEEGTAVDKEGEGVKDVAANDAEEDMHALVQDSSSPADDSDEFIEEEVLDDENASEIIVNKEVVVDDQEAIAPISMEEVETVEEHTQTTPIQHENGVGEGETGVEEVYESKALPGETVVTSVSDIPNEETSGDVGTETKESTGPSEADIP